MLRLCWSLARHPPALRCCWFGAWLPGLPRCGGPAWCPAPCPVALTALPGPNVPAHHCGSCRVAAETKSLVGGYREFPPLLPRQLGTHRDLSPLGDPEWDIIT